MQRSHLKKHIFKEITPMEEYPNHVKEKLLSLISEMSANPAPYVKNPGKDFTRTRNLPFEAVVKLLISMGGNSICKELLEATDYDENTATTSAFVQQRDKILPSAFETLFRNFTTTHANIREYHGYRLLAADGSDLHTPTNPDDHESYFQNHPGEKGYLLSLIRIKYSVGLTNFHTKKQEYIVQEIFAGLIMYNFAEMITSHVVISKADTKHTYQVDFTVAIHICRRFLRSNAPPLDVEALIRQSVLPVRVGRKTKRAIRSKSSTSFLYRVA